MLLSGSAVAIPKHFFSCYYPYAGRCTPANFTRSATVKVPGTAEGSMGVKPPGTFK